MTLSECLDNLPTDHILWVSGCNVTNLLLGIRHIEITRDRLVTVVYEDGETEQQVLTDVAILNSSDDDVNASRLVNLVSFVQSKRRG